MTATEVPALLDQLDALRAAGTQGRWAMHPNADDTVVGEYADGGEDGLEFVNVADCRGEWPNARWEQECADSALIVAAVNALPQLTAAIRAMLRLADAMEEEAAALPIGGTGSGQHYADGLRHATSSDAKDIRNVLTAVLAEVAP